MSNVLTVLLNGISQVEYDRTKEVPDFQLAYLDEMDQKMDKGVPLGNETVSNPDQLQRAQFVASQLLPAIKTGNESVTAAMCTYLANRIPELKAVKITESNGKSEFDLVFDREYQNQQSVQFTH